MKYQSIILAAGPATADNPDFKKSRFRVDSKETLLELSLDVYKSSDKIVVAVNPDDYKFFISKKLVESPCLLNVTHPTQGSLPTSGMCLDLIANDMPILISAIDGLCFDIIEDFLFEMQRTKADGGVIVFPSKKLNYSYVRVSQSVPIEFAEKIRIGELATSGIYFFRDKHLLIESIQWAILNQISYKNNYYLSAAMNRLIFKNRKVVLFKTAEENYYRFSSEGEAMESVNRMRVKNIG